VGDNYETEVSMQGVIGEANGRDVIITGTADVLAITDEEIFVIDWKFGRESGQD
jgi:ATP-dependent exoDNAse (exonuclease V) beta subunit